MIKVKSLYDIAIEKKITNTFELLKLIQGKRLRTIESNHKSGHNYSKEFVMPTESNGGWANGNLIANPNTVLSGVEQGKGSIYLSELALAVSTKKELEEELAQITDDYNKTRNILEQKIEILEELGLEEYDEKIIKIVQVMDNFEPKKGSKLNKLEHAKLLAEALES